MKLKGASRAKLKEFYKKENLDKTFPSWYLKSQIALMVILFVNPFFFNKTFNEILFYVVIGNGAYIIYKYLNFKVDGGGEA